MNRAAANLSRPTRMVLIRALIARTESLLSTQYVGVAMLLLVACGYTLAYLNHPNLPGNNPAHPEGWWGYWDQGWYLKSAEAWSRLDFSPNSHWYPLGIGAIGALFYPLTHAHPFFIPTLLFFTASAWMVWQIALQWVTRIELLLLAVIFAATHSWFIRQSYVLPWNTLATQSAIYGVFYLLFFDQSPVDVMKASTIAAAAFTVRPIDGLSLAPILILMTLRLPTWRNRLVFGGTGAAIIAAVAIILAAAKLKIYGSTFSPYDENSRDIGFFSQPMWLKIYWIFFHGDFYFHETTTGLLFRYPWLWFSASGLVAIAASQRATVGAACLTGVISGVVYVGYNDLHAANLYRFCLIHYFAWMFPFLFIAAYYGVTRYIIRRRQIILPVLVVSAAMCSACWHLEMRPVADVSIQSVSCGLEVSGLPASIVEISIPSLSTEPLPEIHTKSGTPVKRFRDFLIPFPSGRFRILFTRDLSRENLIIQSGEQTPAGNVHVSSLHSLWKLPVSDSLLMKAMFVHVTASRSIAQYESDMTGPQGIPDGKPDFRIHVNAPEWALARVANWTLERTDSPGMWTTLKNPNGWWPISVVTAKPAIRDLFIPDVGQLKQGSGLVLHGFGSDGSQLFSEPIVDEVP